VANLATGLHTLVLAEPRLLTQVLLASCSHSTLYHISPDMNCISFEDFSRLEYSAMQSRWIRPTFQKWLLSPSFFALMEVVRISETSVYFNETTRRYIPEGCHHTRRCENLKPCTTLFTRVPYLRLVHVHNWKRSTTHFFQLSTFSLPRPRRI
jgi:hypothetical protein